jgi:serine/threonine-protein kinase
MSAQLLVGQTVAGYRVLKPHGEGGMGVVYAGEKDGTRVIIKVARPGEEDQLLREAKFLASLKHRHLPRVLDFTSGHMVMEFVEGETVEEHVGRLRKARNWNLSDEYLRTVVDWCLQMADVLHFLHSLRPRPIIHRDIKSRNVIVRPSGRRTRG